MQVLKQVEFCVPLYGLWLTYRSHGDTSNDLPFHHSYSIFLFWTCIKQTCQALLGSQRACARCITASANICSTHQLQTWHAEQQATKVCLEKQRGLYELQRKCIFAAPKHEKFQLKESTELEKKDDVLISFETMSQVADIFFL